MIPMYIANCLKIGIRNMKERRLEGMDAFDTSAEFIYTFEDTNKG